MRQSPNRALDLEGYIPYYLISTANKFSWNASRHYVERFGVGINEWRFLSTLVLEPGISAARVREVVGFDRGTASRSTRVLEKGGYITSQSDPADGRQQLLTPTEAGYVLHDALMEIALEREKALLAGLDEGEVATLLGLLRKLRANVHRAPAALFPRQD